MQKNRSLKRFRKLYCHCLLYDQPARNAPEDPPTSRADRILMLCACGAGLREAIEQTTFANEIKGDKMIHAEKDSQVTTHECIAGFMAPVSLGVGEYDNARPERKAYDPDTTGRFFDLVFKMATCGAITDEVNELALCITATMTCAVQFPLLVWRGETYLTKQAYPENYEAL